MGFPTIEIWLRYMYVYKRCMSRLLYRIGIYNKTIVIIPKLTSCIASMAKSDGGLDSVKRFTSLQVKNLRRNLYFHRTST